MEQLETIQRRAVRWIFKLERLDGVTDCMLENGIEELEIRRQDLDLKLLRKIEFGHYDVDLSNYVSFNLSYLTRHGTVNPHFGSDQFKFSFFNRMRPMVTKLILMTPLPSEPYSHSLLSFFYILSLRYVLPHLSFKF